MTLRIVDHVQWGRLDPAALKRDFPIRDGYLDSAATAQVPYSPIPVININLTMGPMPPVIHDQG